MNAGESTDTTWKKSSLCASSSCVEVRRLDGGFAVRSSDSSPVLIFSPAEWKDFLAGVRLGEFDN